MDILDIFGVQHDFFYFCPICVLGSWSKRVPVKAFYIIIHIAIEGLLFVANKIYYKHYCQTITAKKQNFIAPKNLSLRDFQSRLVAKD